MPRKLLFLLAFLILAGLAGSVITGLFRPLVRLTPPLSRGLAGGEVPAFMAEEALKSGLPAPATTTPPKAGEWEAQPAEVTALGGQMPPEVSPRRALIINVGLRIEVPEGTVMQKASLAHQVATRHGGWVEYSYVSESGATISLRIPVPELEAALSELRQLGTVKYESRSASDVTDQLVDLDARLRNAREEEQRLLEILQRANTVDEILMVEDRLSAVRERIERLEAMKKSLEEQVDYATVSVEIVTPPEEPEEPWLPEFSLRELVRRIVYALIIAIEVILVGSALLAPLVVVGWVGLAVYRKIKAPPAPQTTPPS